jgi:hypothetical protein
VVVGVAVVLALVAVQLRAPSTTSFRDGVPEVAVGADLADTADQQELQAEVGNGENLDPGIAVAPDSPVDPLDPTIATWQQLASCESSGNWGINSGNGFYGGLQFTLDSWRLVGGNGYPHHHTALEQIHRAERLLDLQGWVAWPVCSVKLGLRPPTVPRREIPTS